MDELKELYYENERDENPLKGFTKSFIRKGKEKKEENPQIKELLMYKRENKLVLGSRSCEKLFKNNKIEKVFLASNCKEITAKMIKHYGEISGIKIVTIDLNNEELGAKLGKPFMVSVLSVIDKQKKEVKN
jgi:ribosomal protein L30E